MDTKPLGLSEQDLIARVGYLANIDAAGLLTECVQLVQFNDKNPRNFAWEAMEARQGYEHLVDALQRCYRVPKDLAERAVGEWALGDRAPVALADDVVDMYLSIAQRMLHHKANEGEREYPPDDESARPSHVAGRTHGGDQSADTPDKILRERARRRGA